MKEQALQVYKALMAEIQQAMGGSFIARDFPKVIGVGTLASVYAVTDLAIASLASAGMAMAERSACLPACKDAFLSSIIKASL